MPISKKPRSKTAFRTSTKATAFRTSTKARAPAALPDRQAMETFLAAIAEQRGDDATAKAQDVMYEAWERTTSRSRIALARKALGISPLRADAYVLLAEEARSLELDRLALPLEGRMADIEWKPLPTGLWTPPAVFVEVGTLLLQAFTDDGVPTWEISKKRGERGEWKIIAKGTADSFEAAKAAALFEAEAASWGS